MLQLEEEEGEEGIKVIMEKATNNESKPNVVEGSKMFTKATSVNRKYSEEEKKLLNSYNSMDYLPPHSQVSKIHYPLEIGIGREENGQNFFLSRFTPAG